MSDKYIEMIPALLLSFLSYSPWFLIYVVLYFKDRKNRTFKKVLKLLIKIPISVIVGIMVLFLPILT